MPHSDNLEEEFRFVTKEVRGEPVRWKRVQRRARRRRLIVLCRIVVMTALIAGGFVAIKALVDPAYRAQLSSASTTVTFGKERAEQGSTRLGEYLRESGLPPVQVATPVALREEGFVFHATLKLVGFRSRQLNFEWALDSAAARRQTPVVVYPGSGTIRPMSSNLTESLGVWMSYPTKTGRYRVKLLLRDTDGRVVNESQSRSFTVSAPRIATPYKAPGYAALLPSGWRFTKKYMSVPPHRFVTRMVGPGGLSVLIDTTRHVNTDPASSAGTLDALFRGRRTYYRSEFFRTSRAGSSAFEWSFDFEGLRTTDIFFNRGGDGYAVLAEGSPRHAVEIRAVALRVSRSLEPR